MSLRRLDVRLSEDQLNDSNVDPVGQRSAGAFVSQIVSMEIDLAQLRTIDASSSLGSSSVMPVRDQQE